MTVLTPVPAVSQMARRLTTPFTRGADTQPLQLIAQGSPTQARVDAYDFQEHRALFNHLPDPRYMLIAQDDLAVDTAVMIAYTASPGGSTQQITLTLPAGSLAGTSFILNLDPNEGPDTRLTTLTIAPAADDGEAAHHWRLIALLGVTAKLLWVLGWERDHISRQMARTTAQHQLLNALGLSLDLIGYDLGIPRFPPLPYSFDEATIALYHLNDQPGAVPAVEDIIGRYPGQPGHDGTLADAVVVGMPGRFGSGFSFSSPNATVTIPNHSDFDLSLAQSFTAECFVQPSGPAVEGHLLSKHSDPTTSQAGWALSVGDFERDLPLNPRWLVSDGVNPPLVLFADLSLSTGRFTHLAGVIDRQAGLALLYVDGQIIAQKALGSLQAITNAEPVRIGFPSAPLPGVVEEVRLSRVARSDFHPVLGKETRATASGYASFGVGFCPRPPICWRC